MVGSELVYFIVGSNALRIDLTDGCVIEPTVYPDEADAIFSDWLDGSRDLRIPNPNGGPYLPLARAEVRTVETVNVILVGPDGMAIRA